MKLFGKDLDHDLVIIAEIGINHEGDVDAASRLIKLAAEAGADAAKLQSFTASRYASASDPARLERVKKFALDEAAHRRLVKEARALNMPLISTPLSEDMVPLLDALCPAIKIASGDLTFEPVIRAAARGGKPVILSTGLGTVEEIDRALDWVRAEVGDAALRDRLVLLQCVTAYPTPVTEANVLSVPFLAKRYGVSVGYSNHVIGPEACYAAVALGASVLEVHFTDQKTGREFRDHELSFEPDDLVSLIATATKIRASLGVFGKDRQASELPNLKATRKGVIAARDLSAGAMLSQDNLTYARPGTEFAADELPSLIGRCVIHAVGAGELIARDNVEGGQD